MMAIRSIASETASAIWYNERQENRKELLRPKVADRRGSLECGKKRAMLRQPRQARQLHSSGSEET